MAKPIPNPLSKAVMPISLPQRLRKIVPIAQLVPLWPARALTYSAFFSRKGLCIVAFFAETSHGEKIGCSPAG